jgi:PAS domain-containing protein
MNDKKKTKEQLIHELGELRQRIAELEESKTASSQSEKELMESTLDSIMFTEQVGYITKVNKHFLELLGYSEDEVVGKFVAELTPTDEGETYESTTGEAVKIDKAFLDRTQTLIEELLTKGKILNWEAYYLRKDKKVVPIEQNIVCLYDKKGERTGAISIIRDITDRRQAAKELEIYRNNLEDLVKERTEKLSETNDYLDNIIDSSLDSTLIGDATGNIVRFNQSFLP